MIGLVQVVEEMLKIYNDRKLDPFKTSVSLPGLTQQYLFKNLENDYFVTISEEHKDLFKLLKKSICGGPSIIFRRYHEKGKTKIRNGTETCEKVLGYDCNSLYLFCLAQLMPTGNYSRRKQPDFKRESKFSDESIQWLTWVSETTGAKIQHGQNRGEVRIENYFVDGFDENTNTIYEYYGCYHHGHCHHYNPTKWTKTMKREEDLRKTYNVVTITSCEWFKMDASKKWNTPDETDTLTVEDIIHQIKNDELFGFVRCDVRVPDELKETYSEFPPVFKNTEITLADIGDHMQEYCRKTERKTGVKRSLIGSMHAQDILLLTPLVKEYLDMGLVVENIEEIIEYNGKSIEE